VGILSLPLMAWRIHRNGHHSLGEGERNPIVRPSYHCSTAPEVFPKASDVSRPIGMCHLGGPCSQRHHSVESCKVRFIQRTDGLNLCVLVDGKGANEVNVDQSGTLCRCLQAAALIASCSGALVNATRGQLDWSNLKLQVRPSLNRLSFNTRCHITILLVSSIFLSAALDINGFFLFLRRLFRFFF